MRRREFVTLVSGTMVAWPLVARAQPSGKIWRIGFIAHRYEEFYDPLFQGLRELGYTEGQNLVVERRYAEGRVERFKEFAAEMVQLKVDLIIVVTTPAALAARNATTTIPIVHPAGAVLWNAANPANTLAWKETEGAGRALGVAIQSHEVRGPGDFEGAFAMIAQQRPDILLVLQDALTLEYRKEIIGFALRERLPSMYVGKLWAEEGGLMSYGDRLPERYRRAADVVDRILKGAKPTDLPVEQPTTFELVVNLKTAKAIGLNLPPAFLARADQVIE